MEVLVQERAAEQWDREMENSDLRRAGLVRRVLKRAKSRLRTGRLHRLFARVRGTWPPPWARSIRPAWVNQARQPRLRVGSGDPIDRYYIENFLQHCANDIKGRVLEIADDEYSSRFGGSRITRQDILHVEAEHSRATLVGDLAQPGVLPEDAFDCIVLTQTLHLIYDMKAALNQLHAALRPGGVLLLTVPGISQIDRGEWQKSWYWNLTSQSVTRLLSEVFDTTEFVVERTGMFLPQWPSCMALRSRGPARETVGQRRGLSGDRDGAGREDEAGRDCADRATLP